MQRPTLGARPRALCHAAHLSSSAGQRSTQQGLRRRLSSNRLFYRSSHPEREDSRVLCLGVGDSVKEGQGQHGPRGSRAERAWSTARTPSPEAGELRAGPLGPHLPGKGGLKRPPALSKAGPAERGSRAEPGLLPLSCLVLSFPICLMEGLSQRLHQVQRPHSDGWEGLLGAPRPRPSLLIPRDWSAPRLLRLRVPAADVGGRFLPDHLHA